MSALPDPLRTALDDAGLRAVDVALADWGWRHGGERAGALGLALTSHAVGLGHTCLPLDALGDALGTASRLVNAERFSGELAENPLVARPDGEHVLPLVLDGQRLYLQRYWDYERRLARRLRELIEAEPAAVDTARLGPEGGLFSYDWTGAGETNWQAVAAFVAQRQRLAVISGGPGTGKTYTIVRLMLRLIQAALETTGEQPPVFRLAAPTGKAAARMIASVRRGLEELQPSAEIAAHLPHDASTLHRLLRLRRGSTVPGHDRDRPIPADVVIVDEASMVDLPLMAKLADAVADGARLILLGDRYQLASVESGAVLADLCAPAGVNAFSTDQRAAAGGLLAGAGTEPPSPLADHVVTLQTSHRFRADSAIGRLAAAINAGDAEAVEGVLGDGGDEVRATFDTGDRSIERLVRDLADVYAPLHEAGTPEAAIAALEQVRLLTATRVGPHGSEQMNLRIGRTLAERHGFDPESHWHHGRPIMIVQNEPRAGLFNGDVGVVWRDEDGHVRAWFRTEEGLRSFHPSVLPAHDTVYAMTIHKSQGSEFKSVYLLLPRSESRLLTRELLYTAVTRARRSIVACGAMETWSSGVQRRIRRYSNIGARLEEVES